MRQVERHWIKEGHFRKAKQSDMLSLPSKVSTNILKILGSSINSYYQVLKSFHDKSNLSVTSKPQLPRYFHKTEGRYVVEFTNQTISKKRGLNGELILCPKDLNLVIPIKVKAPKSVRIVPRLKSFVIEVVYEVEVSPLKQTGNYAAIDLGVDNLATITFSNGVNPLVVKGSKLKSINQGYNRLIAKATSKLPANQKLVNTSTVFGGIVRRSYTLNFIKSRLFSLFILTRWRLKQFLLVKTKVGNKKFL